MAVPYLSGLRKSAKRLFARNPLQLLESITLISDRFDPKSM
jgi:hypothetical protein